MRRFGVGLGLIGIAVLAVVALSMAFADDEKPSPSPDDGLDLIIEEPSDGVSLDGDMIGGTLPEGDGTYRGPADADPPVKPSEPAAPTPSGRIPALPPDAPVSSTPGAPQPSNPSQPTPTPGLAPLPAGTQRVLAPIDGAEILIRESFPPQYALRVQAGLPSGCAKPAGYEVSRSGDTIRVSVYNSLPEGNVICTAIYGIYELNISLGSDFDSGKTYTVQVNDKQLTLRAQ